MIRIAVLAWTIALLPPAFGVAQTATAAQALQTATPAPGASVPAQSSAPQAAPSLSPVETASPLAPSVPGGSGQPPAALDPFIWLEDPNSPRALAWVRAQNAKSLAILERDPHYALFYAQALKLVEAKDRIPVPEFMGGNVFNFWQDAHHVRGIWRETTLTSYRSAAPRWTTVLDVDALAKSEHANWVWKGADCRWPRDDRCLVSLSDGGEDATTVREFDIATRRFVPGGFFLPHGKQDVSWFSDDALLVSREWKAGELTTSGYPFIVERVTRGRPLAAATEVFRGKRSDVDVAPYLLRDGQGDKCVLIDRGVSFFNSDYYVMAPGGLRRLNMPEKAGPEALVANRLIVRLNENWNAGGDRFRQGSLVSLDLRAATADPQHLKPRLVYAPGPREALQEVSATKSRLLVTILYNVRGRALAFAPAPGGGWTREALALPDYATVSVVDANLHGDDAFLSLSGFLTPPSLILADAVRDTAVTVKTLPARFDASKDVVEQRQARSTDGTLIPYFIVHPKHMRYDGSNPTILNAYGGFQISSTPFYGSVLGKLWLDRSEVFVLANIRGGGEFGPAWHEAGLKTHRQIVYDDFAAVAKDLIRRKITSPRRLGIQGGSNGGLLMGVEFTQHPELFNAVDIQVPLLDMLRYEKIAAGASWVGEYGSVSNPKERAFLAKISPYNNLRRGVQYPMPFVWTTTKDDRVGPGHARKFAAKMAALGIPYLFYEVIEGGHGSGANLPEIAKTNALEFTYFTRQLME